MIRTAPPLFGLLVLLITSCGVNNSDLVSPDGKIQVSLQADDNSGMSYTVSLDNREVVMPSEILLEFLEQEDFGAEVEVELAGTSSVDLTWRLLWGKTEEVRDYYNEYTYRVMETGGEGRFLLWKFRIFNDGVAFRFEFPEGSGFGEFKLTGEHTEFNLDPRSNVWATNHEHYYSSQEHTYDERTAGEIGTGELIGCPLLVETGSADWALITEADLTDWAGLYFVAPETGSGNIVSSLASLKREPELKVISAEPAVSPWRVILVGKNPGVFIESDMIVSLNDPMEFEDASWIEPGVAAWDRWWSGDYGPDAGFQLGMNTATMKYFVDLADEMDWEYMIVDWTWYGNVFAEGQGVTPDPAADITTPIEEVDIHEIIRYAGERDVKIILWVLSGHLDRQMDEALALYEEWGAAGIKVDFMDSDDQDMVNWYHTLARKAARHHLVIDFHGAYKPTGVSRTLPNMLTREGVLGNEYTKWSDLITPRHTVVLPFTRGVLGEMDFTPGGFNHIHQEDFETVGASAPNPFVMGTRCHQLAMTVVYESAFTVICDSPYNYKDQPGAEFLKLVPTTWSETRFISGYPGDHIVLARRSGEKWFLGGMTNESPRETTFASDFLPPGEYTVTLWKDSPDSATYPAELHRETYQMNAGDPLTVRMEKGGGFVALVEPV